MNSARRVDLTTIHDEPNLSPVRKSESKIVCTSSCRPASSEWSKKRCIRFLPSKQIWCTQDVLSRVGGLFLCSERVGLKFYVHTILDSLLVAGERFGSLWIIVRSTRRAEFIWSSSFEYLVYCGSSRVLPLPKRTFLGGDPVWERGGRVLSEGTVDARICAKVTERKMQ